MSAKVKCSCGHSWNTSDSSKKDANVCHICGKDNTMKDGGWLDQYQEGGNVAVSDATRTKVTKNTGLKKGVDQPVSNMLDITLGAPQRQLVKMITGKEQYPSEAMGIENPYGAFAADVILDPTNLVGAGLLGKAAKASTKTGFLSNAYKYNPFAFKPKPNAQYRMIGKEGLEDALESGVIRNNPKGQYVKDAPYFSEGFPINGRQYKTSQSYGNYGGPNMIEVTGENFIKGVGPKSKSYITAPIDELNINNPNVKFYTEDWLKGYKEVRKPSVDFSKYLTQEEAIAARAKRLISQKDKPGWNEQFTPDLETRLNNAVKNHDPASNYPGEKLGSNILGRTATLVSKDANLSGVPLTEANKARVAAHETGHYYSNSVAEGEEWLKPFNLNKLESYKTKTYLRGKGRSNNYANEIRERAAQLKDYIAQKNAIPLNQDFKITQTQLDDAIKNYVKDTGLDNTMSKMLGTLKNKKGLLKTMNKYALGAAPVGIVAGALQQKKKNGGWLEKYQEGGPVQENYNDYSVSAGPGFQGDGYSNVGRNYSPAWGGQFAMGGSMPGAVGFTYARTGSIPSNGPYAKKTKASAENGKEMRYYQEGLDWKPKTISKDGSQLVKLDQLTNFTNYNTKQPGENWLDKYQD